MATKRPELGKLRAGAPELGSAPAEGQEPRHTLKIDHGTLGGVDYWSGDCRCGMWSTGNRGSEQAVKDAHMRHFEEACTRDCPSYLLAGSSQFEPTAHCLAHLKTDGASFSCVIRKDQPHEWHEAGRVKWRNADWREPPAGSSRAPTPDPLAALTTHTERMRQTCAQLADEISDVRQVLTVGGPVDPTERAALLEKLARMQRAAAEMAVRQ